MRFLAPTPSGGWKPGIGDPSLLGWLTVVAYLAAAWLCLRAARRSAASGPRTGAESLIWLGLTGFLIVLGINKQLDLQSALTYIARLMAKQQGWYPERRRVQWIFVMTVATTSLLAVAVTLWIARHHLRRLGMPLLGAGMLLGFVVIRAASFHNVDRLIATRFVGTPINAWLELGGIALLGAGAWKATRPPARPP